MKEIMILSCCLTALLASLVVSSCKTKKASSAAVTASTIPTSTLAPTAVAGYEAEIKMLIINNCHPCHSSPKGGIELSTYEATKAAGAQKRFLASLYHQPGHAAMPPGRDLDQVTLDKITAWVQNGMPE